jgi:hypothetical protein
MRPILSALFAVCFATVALAQDEQPAADDGENPYDQFAHVPPPLREAVKKVGRDTGRWAYTVTTLSRDRKGKVVEDSVARFDPSQHYDVQWTLLKKDGQDATEAQIKKHRKLRAKMQKNRRTLGELLDLERAELIDDEAAASGVLTYRVPVKPEDNRRFPVDKVEVLVRVHRETLTFSSIELRLRQAVRAAVIAKVKNGNAVLLFETVDPAHAPTITRMTADLGASIAFIPVEQHTVQTRGEFKRVTPYDERFQVKLGPLRTIDF